MGGRDFHGLLLYTIIGLRKYFLCPCTPFGHQGILCATDRKGVDGIGTLYSHQYILEDKRVTEEIKGQTFSKNYFLHTMIDKLEAPPRSVTSSICPREYGGRCTDCKFHLSPQEIFCWSVYHLWISRLTVRNLTFSDPSSLIKDPLHDPHYQSGSCKSPVPVWFPAEETLGMMIVPNNGSLSLKVIYTKRTKS